MYTAHEKRCHHDVGCDCDQCPRQPFHKRILATSCIGALRWSRATNPMNATSSRGPTIQQCQIFRDPARKAAGLLDPPQIVETVFHLFDRVEQCPGEQSKPTEAHDAAADTIGEFAWTRRVSWPAASGPWSGRTRRQSAPGRGVQTESFQDGKTEASSGISDSRVV